MNCVSSCVNMNIYYNIKTLIWTFCVEMTLWQLEGVYFPQKPKLSLLVLTRNGIITTFFFNFLIFLGQFIVFSMNLNIYWNNFFWMGHCVWEWHYEKCRGHIKKMKMISFGIWRWIWNLYCISIDMLWQFIKICHLQASYV